MKKINFILICLSLFFATFSHAKQKDINWIDKLDLTQYENKVIYLDFWASWCGPCRKSFPWLNQMQEKYKDQGLVIIGINLDKDIDSANNFLKETPAQFPVLSDPTGKMGKQYQLVGMPSSYLLTSDGQIKAQHIGFKKSETDEYEANIIALLALLPQNKE